MAARKKQVSTGKRITRAKRPSGAKTARKKTMAPRAAPPPRPKAIRSKESKAARGQRALRVLAALKTEYPSADCALRHRSAYELLVATILSAQCTDKRVNRVTHDLFRKHPDAASLADAKRDDLEALIRSTGFFRNKARNLIEMAQSVRDNFNGEIPGAMDDLLKLAGVARKTANCVLGTWFGVNEGVVVDTHIGRLALRLRLLTTARDDKDALRIERDLAGLFPRDSWTYLAHALIQHGRRVCVARKPKCDVCALAKDCPSASSLGAAR